MIITVAGGPSWADIMTAFGTVGAVIAAVGIALWTERRSGRRLAAEQARSDRQLEEERARSAAQIDEERRIERDREQLAQAYAVQVAMGERPAGGATGNVQRPIDNRVRALSVMIVNKGSYTITRIEARFCTDGKNVISHRRFSRLGAFDDLPARLSEGFSRLEDDSGCGDVLAPGDIGMRFESDPVGAQHIAGPFPMVRWTDRWGTRWEHKRGEVQRISDGQQWVP